MVAFALPLIFSFLLFTTITTVAAQPYKATDQFLLDCGSSSPTTFSGRRWDGDEHSKFTPANITTTSFPSKSSDLYEWIPKTPCTTARIFNASSFAYTFPVSKGPKFLRLHFCYANYPDLRHYQFFFSVSSNGYTLLTYGPSLIGYVYQPKEFIIYVKDTQTLDVIFTPLDNSYAFISGIEIVSMPEHLYYKPNSLKYVGISDNMAQETVYRLNVGGDYISRNNDTGMYRSWDTDYGYMIDGWYSLQSVNKTPITYTMETPNYTAPEPVYATQRIPDNPSEYDYMSWLLSVDSGFYYTIRLHFCNIIPQHMNRSGEMIFTIFIYNSTSEKGVYPFYWTKSGDPVFEDYVVFVSDPEDGSQSIRDLRVEIHPNVSLSQEYGGGYLNGLEAFKWSTNGSLSATNPQRFLQPVPFPYPTPSDHSPEPPTKVNRKNTPYAAMIGGVGGGLGLLFVLVLIVLWRLKHHGWATVTDELSSNSALPSDRCRRFTLEEMKVSTGEFNDNCAIGKGGFGKVYKGYIKNGTTTVAIKRLNPSSSQGFREFHTEIGLLSKLRHVHLVPLIGYCDDHGEMMLVYEYMAYGTLRDHLYKSNNPRLPWKTRLRICIGAAKGLQYLHTGVNRKIIHRDVKSTNILLDENWVAKVSDFGLSKLGPKDPSETHVSTFVKGSIGYLDPEYCRRKRLTNKSDVYSFGVVLFEVLCARPVIIQSLPHEQVNLAEWGKYCYRRGTLDEIIDATLRDEIAGGSLRKFGEVANSCLKEEGSDRPAMDDIVYGLEFALLLQEAAEKMDDEAVSNNHEESTLMDRI